MPIHTVGASGLRDVRRDGDDERDGDVLEHEDPGPLIITIYQPNTERASSERCRTHTIPFQATLTAPRLQQAIENPIAQLRIRHRIRDEQQEIARQSNGFVRVRPRLEIDRRRRNEAGEKVDEREGGD